MLIEYILLLVVSVGLALKFFVSEPLDAFRNASPNLGARMEQHLATGQGFLRSDPDGRGAVPDTWKRPQ